MQGIQEKIDHILQWSTRHTKVDMTYIARGGFWLGIGQVFSSLSGLVLTIIFANFLPAEIFGTYKFVLAVAAIIAIPTLTGLNTALIRSIAQHQPGALQATLRAKLRWGLLAFVFGVAIASYYFIYESAMIGRAIFIAALFVPLMELGGLHVSILLGTQNFQKNAKYDLALHGGAFIAIATAVLLTDNIFILLITYFAFWTAGRLYALYRVARLDDGISASNAGDASSESMALGTHLSIIGVINNIASNIDKVLLFQLLGPASVAIYSIALSPIQRLNSFAQLIKPLSIPKFAQQTTTLTRGAYWRKFIYLETVLILVAVLYIVFAPSIFSLIFPAYMEAVFYSQILAVGIIGAATFLNSSVLIALDARKQLYIQSSIVNGTHILLTVLGIYFFGILGALGAFVISRLLYVSIGTIQIVLLLKNPATQ